MSLFSKSIFLFIMCFPIFMSAQWTPVSAEAAYSEGPILNQKILFHPETSEPYIAFYDFDLEFNNVGHISMLKFNGSEWEYVGPRMFGQENVSDFSGAQEGVLSFKFTRMDNRPVVCLRRVNSQDVDGASVLEWNGSEWEQLGEVIVPGTEDGGGFSGTNYVMDLHPGNDYPAIVYQDQNLGGATVRNFVDPEWGLLGAISLTDFPSSYNSLTYNPVTAEPYIIHDGNESGILGVKKFTGSLWEDVGQPEIATAPSIMPSNTIVFHPLTNEPYIAYFSLELNPTASVRIKRFDGEAWVNVGENQEEEIWAFNPGINPFSFKIHPITGDPYLLFVDGENGGPTMYRFDGEHWVRLGTEPVFPFITNGLDFDFHPTTGIPMACVIGLDGRGEVYEYAGSMVGVLEPGEKSGFSLYPNPANESFRVMGLSQGFIEVFDLNGRAVIRTSEDVIHTDVLDSGVYIVRITDQSGRQRAERLFVQ